MKKLVLILMFVSSICFGTDAVFNNSGKIVISNSDIPNSSNNLVPAGSLMMYASTVAPSGWLLCDGTVYSTTTYSALYLAIGTSYSTGTVTTGFNVPNMKGRTGMGFDVSQSSFSRIGQTGGEISHTLTIGQMPSHSHDFTDGYNGGAVDIRTWKGATINALTTTTNATGGGGNHNVLDPYVVVNYIIKY